LMTFRASRSSSCLFFLRHDLHRHHLSFPTRRSSDLRRTRRGSLPPAWSSDRHPTQVSRQRAAARARRGLCGDPAVSDKLQTLRTDRKSTRLNSSHVSISYAVFCLKKKYYKITSLAP